MDCTMNIGIGCGQIVFNQVAIINYMKIKKQTNYNFPEFLHKNKLRDGWMDGQ